MGSGGALIVSIWWEMCDYDDRWLNTCLRPKGLSYVNRCVRLV